MFGPPSIEELNLQNVMEFDPNSPRLRLSLVTYLLENGALGIFEGNIEDVIDAAEVAISFVTEGQGDYLLALEAAQIVPEPAEIGIDNDDDPIDGSGYSYL